MKYEKSLFKDKIPYLSYIVLLVLSFHSNNIICQLKYDYNWVIASSADGIPGIDAYIIDFNDGKRTLSQFSAYNIIHLGNAIISDQDGQIQFFTNGCEIMDTQGGLITNGEVLIPGQIHDLYCDLGYYPSIQNSTILPDLSKDNKYYYLHKELVFGTLDGNDASLFPNLRYSFIHSDDSYKEVIIKSEVIDTIGYRFSASMESILNANGEDWWIVDYLLEESGGQRLIYSLNETGISYPKQELFENQDALKKDCSAAGQSAFSPNGKLYAKYCSISGIDIFDFDRATGEFSNHRHFSTDLQYNYSGLAFSPNSRFIYISSHDKLHQLDLWEDNLEDGFVLIGEYDGFLDPFPTNFTYMQLGPDCRIYMTSTNGVSSFHVINQPNEKGLDCEFIQHGFELPVPNGAGSIPNFPVFRFDDHEVCDPTITSIFDFQVEVVQNLDIFPNPTNDMISIAFPNDLNNGRLFVKTLDGELLHQQDFGYAGSQRVSLGDYNSGIYIIEVVSEGRHYVDRIVKVQ